MYNRCNYHVYFLAPYGPFLVGTCGIVFYIPLSVSVAERSLYDTQRQKLLLPDYGKMIRFHTIFGQLHNIGHNLLLCSSWLVPLDILSVCLGLLVEIVDRNVMLCVCFFCCCCCCIIYLLYPLLSLNCAAHLLLHAACWKNCLKYHHNQMFVTFIITLCIVLCFVDLLVGIPSISEEDITLLPASPHLPIHLLTRHCAQWVWHWIASLLPYYTGNRCRWLCSCCCCCCCCSYTFAARQHPRHTQHSWHKFYCVIMCC